MWYRLNPGRHRRRARPDPRLDQGGGLRVKELDEYTVNRYLQRDQKWDTCRKLQVRTQLCPDAHAYCPAPVHREGMSLVQRDEAA